MRRTSDVRGLSADTAGGDQGSSVHRSYVAGRNSVVAQQSARACERGVLDRQDVVPFCTIDSTSQGIPKKSGPSLRRSRDERAARFSRAARTNDPSRGESAEQLTMPIDG